MSSGKALTNFGDIPSKNQVGKGFLHEILVSNDSISKESGKSSSCDCTWRSSLELVVVALKRLVFSELEENC